MCMKKVMEPQGSPNQKYIQELYKVEKNVAKADREKWEAHIDNVGVLTGDTQTSARRIGHFQI